MRRTSSPYTIKKGEAISAADLAQRLGGTEKSPGQFMARCPAHADKNPSLAISEQNGSILLHCFAGCRYENIIRQLSFKGITIKNNLDVERSPGLPPGVNRRFKGMLYTAHWTYRDEYGEVIGYVVRYESGAGEKIIIPYFKKESKMWKAGYATHLKNNRPLYNLDKIERASPEEEIFVVEGEKCADTLTKMGIIATTSPGGASAAKKADWGRLAGNKIIIWPDNDKAGKSYAANVFTELVNTGDSDPDIKAVDVDQLGLKEKEDVYDWIRKGHTKKEILDLPLYPVSDYSDLKAIVIEPGEVWKAVDEAEKLLMKANPHAIFQQGNRLVRVLRTPSKGMIGGNEDNIGLTSIVPGYLLDLWNRRLTFLTETGNGLKAVDPPAKVANRYLAKSGQWHVNTLSGLIYAPTLRPDGSVLQRPGYDEKSGVFYCNSGLNIAPLKTDPGKEDAENALKRLRYILQDFPFVSDADESVAIAAILTALIRQSLGTAPLFGFTAPVAGSGKTLLANVISIIATGRQAVVAPHGRDSEEERKHLFAKLLQGKPVLLIDNIERPLSSDVLCAILTAPGNTYSDRILGRSEIVEVPTNVTFLATGNNLTFQGDMTRRALLCTIDPRCENPEAREDFRIKGRLEDFVMDRREGYVKNGLTILKAYANAGKPKQKIPQYGSFEEWSNWVRSALVWLGCADPNLTREKIEQSDPVKTNNRVIVNLWNKIYGNSPMKVSEIVTDCNEAIEEKNIDSDIHELAQMFIEVTRTRGKLLNGSSVGYWLRANKDKIINGYKLTTSPYSAKGTAKTWELLKT